MQRQELKKARITEAQRPAGWTVRKSEIPERALFDRVIGILPHHKVVYIGAYGSVYNDPLAAYLSAKVRSGGVKLVDAQDSRLKDKLVETLIDYRRRNKTRSIKPVSERIDLLERANTGMGQGGLLVYRRDARDFSGTKNIKLIPAQAQQLPFRKNYADLLVDRGTFRLIWKNQPDPAQVIKNYLRTVKNGGKVVFLAGRYSMGFETDLPEDRQIIELLQPLVSQGKIHVQLIPIKRAPKYLFRGKKGKLKDAPKNKYAAPTYGYAKAIVVTKLYPKRALPG